MSEARGHQHAIKAVWCDFGGVLTPPIVETFLQFCDRVEIPAADLLGGMQAVAEDLGLPLMAPLDLAILTQAEWGRRVAERVERQSGVGYDFDRFAELWFADRPTNGVMVDQLRELRRRGYQVGMLTNNVREWESHWRSMLPVEEIFDDVVNSCEVGVRKPDPAIYEIAECRFGVEPAQCLLIDDMEENAAAARERGWSAVTFENNEQGLAELAARLDPDGVREPLAARPTP